MNSEQPTYAGVAMAGAVAGMRSMSAPALISSLSHRGNLPGSANSLVSLGNPTVAKVTLALALGEFVADKLPFTPRRTVPGAVAVRALSGGLAGAAICSAKKRSVFWGAVIGAAAAVGATYAAYELRRRAVKNLHVPDFIAALAEDALVAGVACLAAKSFRSEAAL